MRVAAGRERSDIKLRLLSSCSCGSFQRKDALKEGQVMKRTESFSYIPVMTKDTFSSHEKAPRES